MNRVKLSVQIYRIRVNFTEELFSIRSVGKKSGKFPLNFPRYSGNRPAIAISIYKRVHTPGSVKLTPISFAQRDTGVNVSLL